jgi:hypothetical protein
MRYMMFIKHTEDYRGKPIPPGLIEAMDGFIGEYAKQGKFIDGAGLKSSHKGKKIQLRKGKLNVVDGPFTETKELVGGYFMMQAKSFDEVMEWMKRCPGLREDGAELEIRRLIDVGDFEMSEEANAMHARLEEQVRR